MNDFVNENDQWEAIKSWWRSNGTQLIIMLVIALALGFSWRFWQQYQLTKSGEASQLFDQLLSVQITDPTSATIDQIASELEKDYPRTPYASLASLFAAKSAVLQDQLPIAEQKLHWALDHAKTSQLQEIARLRLARVLLAEKKFPQALAVLEKTSDSGFAAAVEQVRGDIYLAQGKTAQARTAYQNAYNAMPPSEAIRSYVAMQLNQLPAAE